MQVQSSRLSANTTGSDTSGELTNGRSALRVDAQRNLEHVLRAAREVFGELGYGAPMEDVARRARVGVGTVYRRFPSKEVLVKRIAEAETARLTEQARAALQQEDEPWAALARFLRASVDSGAGRLLPPQVLGVTAQAPEDEPRVPQQRPSPDGTAPQVSGSAAAVMGAGGDAGAQAASVGGTDAAALLDVVGQLVARARDAGSLRADVSVSDVLLVIATAAPALPDPEQQAVASARLLNILLDGLRPHAEG
ncbi:helix-turn-helix domain containing protein [Streptomyces sp. WMMC500]|uniref:TetR/AcrR family transcriptional regulator n=1 Tax=Streptomyces sp. WMMC500 TaxID=3015154 RepID=UPI00248CF5E2|nr:TetR/AcrR family transcriptional regulator [Streptomyces sp. WMMC500]WBB63968.1 helix-turn-helix domain containing protein [Streptomyces sp. WMMC500]